MDSVSRRTRRSLSAGDNFTPRTLIQGFLQTAQTIRQSPQRRARITQSTRIKATSQRKKPRLAGILTRSATSSPRHSASLQIPTAPGGSDPTPRGLITGFLQAADVQTPVVHVPTRQSSPLKQPTPFNRNVHQTRAESASTSSSESPNMMAFSRIVPFQRKGRLRQRHHAIDREEFAARVRERMGQEDTEAGKERDEGGAADETKPTTDRTAIESIMEETLEGSEADLPSGDISNVEAPGSGHTRLLSNSEQGLTHNTSQKIPSASPPADVSTQDIEKKASHHSMSSIEEEDTVMAQANQDTMPAHSSFNTDMEEVEDQGGEGVQDQDGDEVEQMTSRGGKPHEMEMEKGESDSGDSLSDSDSGDGLSTSDVFAPTQPASAGKKTGSPLKTPHLKTTRRRTTPTAKTPAIFQPSVETSGKKLLQARMTQRRALGGDSQRSRKPPPMLPKSLTKSIFTHFSRLRAPRDAIAVVEEASEKFFRNISRDLVAYSKHAGRHTIEQADVELLMKRQRLITEREPLQSIIEKYLPMEYREQLIPMARSGNKVYPRLQQK